MKKITFSLLFCFAFSFANAQLIDSIIDIRDSQIYKIVKIGQQWWMRENLNIGTRINGTKDDTDNGIIEKCCCDDNVNNCEIYGGLYRWEEAMDYNPSDTANPGNTRGICPIGWHIPTYQEWTELVDYLGGNQVAGGKLKEAGTTHWLSPNTGATNESGFTALPAGTMWENGYWAEMTRGTWFLSSTEEESDMVWFMQLGYNQKSGGLGYLFDYIGVSVRCLYDFDNYSYLTIWDTNFESISGINFYGSNIKEELILLNSGTTQTINISSVYTNNSAFSINKSSSSVALGDSVHFTIAFNPPVKGIYLDTLYIISKDPYTPSICIPLSGISPMEISFTDSSNISCFGLNDGFATITPIYGLPPYAYQWDDQNSTTDSSITGLSPGTYYHVKVTDNQGFSITDSVFLSEPEQLVIPQYHSDTICLNSSKGFIDISLSGGIPPYSFLWSNNQNSQNISNVLPGYYSVVVTDQNDCQITDTFKIQAIIPYDEEEICLVTVDPVTNRNLIIWERTPDQNITMYNIYRETNIKDNYYLIGSCDFENPGTFIDINSDPAKQSYRYKIAILDTCGNESSLSSYHSTMHLTLNVGLNGGTNLIWSKYEGFDVQTYNIWRGSDINNMFLIGSVSGNNFTYTDEYPLAGTNIYQVEVVSPYSCNTDNLKTTYSSSVSNHVYRYPEGIDNSIYINTLYIYPNPFNKSTILSFSNSEGSKFKLYIMDLSGKICHIVDDITTSEYVLNIGDLKQGFYFIELRGPVIYRGKIIIE